MNHVTPGWVAPPPDGPTRFIALSPEALLDALSEAYEDGWAARGRYEATGETQWQEYGAILRALHDAT